MTDKDVQEALDAGRRMISQLTELPPTDDRYRVVMVVSRLVHCLEDRARACRMFEESQR